MANLPDPASVWQAVLGRLQMEMPKEHFNTFLRPCIGHSWHDANSASGAGPALVVAAASSFAVSWLELPLHLAMAREALTKTLGREAAIHYRAMPSVASSNGTAEEVDRVRVQSVTAAPARRTRAPVPDGYDLGRSASTAGEYDWDFVNAATCNPRYTFENFVVGESNQLAYHAASAVAGVGKAAGDGGSSGGYNPLFIYAGSGMGKTHLLHAVGNRALEQNRSVLYVTSEQFTNEFVSAIHRRAMREFRDRYRGLDLLLMDDVQFLAGKEQTQESLFHTFNDLHQAGAQIVLTSDRAPHSIAPLEERLRSRFQWGLLADIRPPSPEMRLAILRAWAAAQRANAPDAVLDLIAQRVNRNIRQLRGAFNRVMAMAQLMNAPLTPESVAEQLDGIAGPDPRADITPEQVLDTVARHFGVSVEQILGRGRTATVAQARQVVMYLLAVELGMPPTTIGRALSGRNHSTVIHGVERIRNGVAGDERLRQSVNNIKAALLDRS
ncbi:MAG: chromosomal replication initiator protein DnaA [Chloroflexota bacterium]|nr:chromosomal replication initiator protein DnaA [Chloroflexota bacterium]MDE2684738.1 chromosomal replication initiator protein DnaA [Chloroflexota bacterium]